MGIDGGGSKTEAVIIDSAGRTLGRGLAGPSNTNFTTRHAAASAFKQAARTALETAALRPEQISRIACTFAMAAPAAFEELGLTAEWSHYSESAVAFERAGIRPAVGVAVVAGTGSSVFGHGRPERTARDPGPLRRHEPCLSLGGWGPVLGDDGSGYDIGRRAIRRVLAAEEGRMAPTSLAEAVRHYFGVDRAQDVVFRLIGTRVKQSLIAGFAVLVGEHAARGDEAAVSILREAGTALADVAAFAAGQLFEFSEEFPFVLAGGVFRAGAYVTGPFEETVSALFFRSRTVTAKGSPGEALARLALRDLRGNR